jgi:hypothetical protein
MTAINKMRNEENASWDHESRITRLEVTIESIDKSLSEIKSTLKDIDKRLWSNFYWMIAGFTGVLGILAKSLHWL